MNSKLKKLRRTSFDELRVRGSQALASFAERHGWALDAKLISDKVLLRLLDRTQFKGSPLELRDHFRTRTSPSFFPIFEDREATLTQFRVRWPQSEKEIVARAQRIVAGDFDLLGLHNLEFGKPIDWHFEPVSQKRSPLIHWSQLNYLNAELFGDKKIIWELNRHQYFATLGQAYWLTDDEVFAETFAAHLNQWIESNPPKLGINWASSLEVAFRSISWLWGFYFFKDSTALTPETFLRTYKILYLNARHLETYLSTYFSPNTHLTGEALGLFYLGTLLPEFKESERWRKTGLRILLDQLDKHVRPDGVYFEQSSYYHRYTTDFYLHLLILLNANKQSVPTAVKEKLRLLLDHLMYITRPDGTTPFFGDDDGGRLVQLESRPVNDFRPTLSTAAALFERADYKYVSSGASEETLWLLGPDRVSKLDRLEATEPAKLSIAFPDGGYYVMRDGWTPTANYLLFDCGPHGTDNCGHAHADALSFELAANGCTLLVDPGTYTYTGSAEMRNWFRSSGAHNTLTVDNESSSVPSGPFSWKHIAESSCSAWIPHERFDYVVASHDGFNRFPQPAIHTRSILFLNDNYFVINDRIVSPGEHQVQAWFHFDSCVAPLHAKENAVRVISENGHSTGLQLCAFAAHGQWIREQGWVSHCYGKREEAPVFAFSVLVRDSQELVTFLLPEVPGSSAKASVREIEALNGRAFEISSDEKLDLLLLRNVSTDLVRGWVETARLKSDFDVTWARFGREGARTPEELVLIEGHALEFEGRTLLRSAKRIKYLVGRRVEDRFRVETDEGVLEIGLPVTDLDSLFAEVGNS